MVDGEVVDGEVVISEVVDGEVVNCEVVDGEVVDGDAVDCEVVNGEVVDDEVIDNRVDNAVAPVVRHLERHYIYILCMQDTFARACVTIGYLLYKYIPSVSPSIIMKHL